MKAWNTAAQALLARIQAGEVIPWVQLIAVGLDVPLYITTAGIPLSWGGQTWQPTGVSVGPVEEDADEFPALALELPAVVEAQLALGLAEDVEGASLRVYDALVDPATGQVADAVLAFAGQLQMPVIRDGGERSSLVYTAEHRGAVARRPKPSRYTHDEQQRIAPGDTFFNTDPATDAPPLVWPGASYFKQ